MAGPYTTASGLLGGADALQQFVAAQKMAQYQAALAAQKQQQQDFENRVLATKTQAEAFKNYGEGQKALAPTPKPIKLMPITTVDAQGNSITKLVDESSPEAAGQEFKQPPKEAPKVTKPLEKWMLKGGGQVIAYQDEGGHLIDAATQQVVDPRTVLDKAPSAVDPQVAEERRLNIEKMKRDAAQSAGVTEADPGALQGLHGDAYLQTLNPAQASKIKALSEGRMAFPTSRAMSQPMIQQLINQVAQYDPTFDAVNYNARLTTRKNFTSGTAGTQVNALNTAIGHLAQLSQAADALGNTSLTPINAIKNYLGTKTGNPAVTNFQAIVQPVSEELTKAWRGTGGAEQDIKSRLQVLSTSNSPEQLHSAIAEIGHLLQSKIDALQNQYSQGMGTADIQMLTPQAQQTLDALEAKAKGGTSSGGPVKLVIGADGKLKIGGG